VLTPDILAQSSVVLPGHGDSIPFSQARSRGESVGAFLGTDTVHPTCQPFSGISSAGVVAISHRHI